MTATTLSASQTGQAPQGRRFTNLVIAFGLVTLFVVAGIVFVAFRVVQSEGFAAAVEVARNLFVILLALELLLIGAAFVVLLLQIARFANLVQNEIRPIVESSTEAVNTVRGTATFLSQQVVEPVMQFNSMMAGARQAYRMANDLGSLRDLFMAVATQVTEDGPPSDTPSASDED